MTRVDVERLARLLEGERVTRWDVSSQTSAAEDRLLELAAALQRGVLYRPDGAFVADLRARLLAAAPACPTVWDRARYAYEDRVQDVRYSLRTVAVVMSIAVGLLVAGVGLAAERALPDHALYRVKLALEQARLAAIPDELQRGAREMSYSKDRIVEAWSAMKRGDQAGVAFALQRADALVQSGAPAWIAEHPPTIASIVSEERVLVIDLLPLIEGNAVEAANHVILTMNGVLAQTEPG